jgi:hypothetical protein
VLPLEYLRHLARWQGDSDRELLQEVAVCLADFEHDPIDLIVACRQLLAHHRDNGTLWWMCARICAADRPGRAAHESARVLGDDQTAPRLAGALPFPHDEPVAVLGWPETVADALAERTDLDIVAVDLSPRPGALRRRLRYGETPLRIATPDELMTVAPTHVLVEVLAASPTTVLVAAVVNDALEMLPDAAEIWLVVPEGRLLPERLYDACVAASASAAHDSFPILGATRVATPSGVASAAEPMPRADCPVPPELLRPLAT